jgi:hypothetical protein
MATCDPRIIQKGNEIIEKWFNEEGSIAKNLGKDVGKFFRQFYETTLNIGFEHGDTPTLAQMRHLDKRVNKLEKGFQKKIGKVAEMFYLPEEVLKNNYQALKTYKYFQNQHNYYQGKKDEYQHTLNTIVHMIGEKSRVMGLDRKGNFRNVKKSHKELQKMYNEYQKVITEEGWGAAEDYWNRNLKDLAKDAQFEVFTLVDDVLRDPTLLTSNPGKYGTFKDIVTEWQRISPKLFYDLKRGLEYYVSALKEANLVTNGKYKGMQDSIQKIHDTLKQRQHYFPTEALNIIPTMRIVQESIYDRATSRTTDYDKLSEYVSNIADLTVDQLKLSKHSKEKKSGDALRRNKDVISMMDNYIRNVTMFNFSGSTTDSLLKGVRRIEELQGKEQEEQARFYSKYLFDTHASMLGLNINSSFGRSMARAVTSWEFMSKLGLNVRGAIRNATQSLQNIVYFGASGTLEALQYMHGEIGTKALSEAKKHGVYFASARELANTLNLFPEVAKSTINGKEVLTYKYDTTAQKFTDGLENFARKAGAPMRVVENKVNRNLTFLIAYALRHRQISNNKGIMLEGIEKAVKQGKYKREKNESESDAALRILDDNISRVSSNFAANMVRELHYEYSPFGKPKIMRGGLASVLTQFMTYGVNFWNYQYKIASQGKDAVLAGDWRSEQAWRMYRLGTLYAFINGVLSPLTNTDIGNLIQHDTYERVKNFTDFMSEDPDTKQRAFFGKGPLVGTVGGPFVSDMITMGNVFGFYDLMSNKEMDERSMLGYLAGYQDYADKRDSGKLYDFVRTLNTQIGRTAFVTIPRAWDGAGMMTLAGIETGLYKSKEMQERKMEYYYPAAEKVGIRKPKYGVKKTKKKAKAPQDMSLLQSLKQLETAARV